MKKYIIKGSSRPEFLDIELPLNIDDTIGSKCNVLGSEFTVTQNGKILVLVNDIWCLTLMDITPEPVVEKPKLEVNKTLEIYFKTKEIEIKTDCTYKELFEAIANEWELIEGLVSEPLPLEYNEDLKLLVFRNEWNITKGSLKHLTNGSYTRYNKAGRSI